MCATNREGNLYLNVMNIGSVVFMVNIFKLGVHLHHGSLCAQLRPGGLQHQPGRHGAGRSTLGSGPLQIPLPDSKHFEL